MQQMWMIGNESKQWLVGRRRIRVFSVLGHLQRGTVFGPVNTVDVLYTVRGPVNQLQRTLHQHTDSCREERGAALLPCGRAPANRAGSTVRRSRASVRSSAVERRREVELPVRPRQSRGKARAGATRSEFNAWTGAISYLDLERSSRGSGRKRNHEELSPAGSSTGSTDGCSWYVLLAIPH